MTNFLLAFVVVIVAAGVGFGVIAYTLGNAAGMSESEPDDYPTELPSGVPVQSADIAALKFPMVLRGYQMAPVDEVLRRLGAELDAAHERIAELEAQRGESSSGGGSCAAWQG